MILSAAQSRFRQPQPLPRKGHPQLLPRKGQGQLRLFLPQRADCGVIPGGKGARKGGCG